jgi:uncharacterized protein
MEIPVLLLLFIGGCISGLFAGLLGLGGGMLFMLIFTTYLTSVKIPDQIIPELIIANAMFAMFIAGFSGSLRHYFHSNFHFKPVFFTGASASVCAISVTHFFIHSKWYNKEVFLVIFLILVLYTGYKLLFIEEDQPNNLLNEGYSVGHFLLIGAVGGSLSSLAGVGGGIAMLPMLTRMLHVSIKKATAISLGVITITSFSTSVYSAIVTPPIPIDIPYTYGFLVLPMTIPVCIGCFICSPVGVSLAHKLSGKEIKLLYLLFLVAAVVNMVYSMML